MNRLVIFVSFLLLTSCSDRGYVQSDESKRIWSLLEQREYKSIDFSVYGDKNWTRVCFLGPYNESSEKALGFPWHVSEYTDVLRSDGHNVIVFATDTKVTEYVIHSRGYGDFWKLSGKCLPRESSTLVKDKESGNWRNYVQEKA